MTKKPDDDKPKRRRRPAPPPVAAPAPLQPWDQQQDETSQAFHAFTIYRGLGYQRSFSRVASELVSQRKVTGRPLTVRANIGKWSRRHRWVERVTAWDREVDRQQQQEDQRARREMRERQASMGMAFQQTLALPVRAILDKLEQNPNLLEEMSGEDIFALIGLAQISARAFPAVVNVEREARGEDVFVTANYQGEADIDRVEEEARLRRVAIIMAQHGLIEPPTADKLPVIDVTPPE